MLPVDGDSFNPCGQVRIATTVPLRKNAKVELISNVPLFFGCSKQELALIAAIADELDVREGTTLIREGDRGREFFIIVDGTASVTRHGHKLNELRAGDWAGEIALITDAPRTATVVTTSPARLLVVTERAFRSVLEEVPSISMKLIKTLGERLHGTI
jgi:CRP/FNR family transcriptional regulator, cyclic AMP receptor protein